MERAMTHASLLTLIVLSAILVACGGGSDAPLANAPPTSPSPTPPTSPSTDDPQLSRTVVMTGLSNPWDLAFSPDGALFFTEKCRGLSVRRSDNSVQRLFGTSGSALVATDFFCNGQSGMHGVAVDPDFAANRYVYVYMSSNLGGTSTNHVVRLTVNTLYTSVSGRTDIVTDISYKAASNAAGGAGAHSGGRLRFGPDNFLYVTTGDNHNGPLPQNLTQLGGKVLRITRTGAAAAGNNTPSGGDARIFTYGHRNVQGITFRPSTAQPFACEHGPAHSDEVTPLVAGGNGGWDPAPQAGVTCGSNYCGYGSNRVDNVLTSMTDLEAFPNAMQPSWRNEGRSQGMGPCTFVSGPQWAAWDGRLIVGIMGAGRMDVLQLNTAGIATAHQAISGMPSARARSLVQAADGSLYVATDGGEIWRIVATP